MTLGIGSYTFGWAVGAPGHPVPEPLDARALIDRAAGWGLRLVQLADNLAPLDALPRAELAALKLEADRAGVMLEVGIRGLDHAHVARHLEVCRALGSTLLRIVIDRAGFEPVPAEVTSELRRLVPLLEEAGITLAIENHDRFAAAQLAEVVRSAESPCVGVCLDTVNSFGALEGPAVVVEALAPLTVNLHVKDFVVRRAGHHMGFAIEGAPAGEGRLDLPWLLARLRAAGRDPNAVLEQWVPPEPRLEDTVAKELAWAERGVRHLRRLIPD